MERELRLFVSVFTVVLAMIDGVRHVLMVRNAEERRADGTVKPAGWGLPGGGVREGENPTEAAVREVAYESGLEVANPVWARYEHNVLEPCPNGFKYTRCHVALRGLADGDFELVDDMRQTLVHIFVADLLWDGPVSEMLDLRRAIAPGEPIVLELTPETGDKLGIREAGESPENPQEISAIGLFPLEELLDRESFPEGFYRSHLSRMRRSLEKAGLINAG